jgi:hypothetical protein
MCLQINKHVLRCARQGVELTDLESLVEQVTKVGQRINTSTDRAFAASYTVYYKTK